VARDRFANIAIRWASAKFNGLSAGLHVIYGLASPRAVSTASSATAADTVRSIDLNTPQGGIVILVSHNNITAGQSASWSGDSDTPTSVQATGANSQWTSMAHVPGTVEDAANTYTMTYGAVSTTSVGLAGAAFR
jgi:hypothetical protein